MHYKTTSTIIGLKKKLYLDNILTVLIQKLSLYGILLCYMGHPKKFILAYTPHKTTWLTYITDNNNIDATCQACKAFIL